MAVLPGVWGIDLGQCALKAVRVENVDGQVTATAFDYVEHPKILSQPDADPDQLTREALEKFLSRNSLKGDIVAISIPGQSGLARFVKLPPVEEKKISDIVRFEAKQQIPFNLEEVVWDYQKLNQGVVTDGFAMETEIGLFAIKRDTVNRYLQHFKDVNVEVQIVQMAPLSLCNYVSYDLLQKGTDAQGGDESTGKKRCVVALDIGADNSNLVITDGERIIWQRPIPLGGNHFTRALTKDMKLTFAKAEHLKRNATKSPDLKQILSSLKPVLNDFVGEVQRSLGYFTNTHRDATVQYMIGLGSAFRLPGIQKFLGEKLQLDVRRLQKLERLTGDEVINAPAYTENVLSFAVAYGLALQGLKLARLQTNLLPHEIRVERMIRAKKPWAVAAAASLVLGASVLAFGYSRQREAVAGDVVQTAMKKGSSVKGQADGFESSVKRVKDKIEEDKKAVKSVIVGQDERLNWLQFNQFVNRSFPRPDGTNLNDKPTKPYIGDKLSAKRLYWNKSAKEAYERFINQRTGKAKSGERLDEEEWRDDLVQANVESIYCVYSQDLPGFYNAVKSVNYPSFRFSEMSEEEYKKPPPEGSKGWLVEVRGYTYHRDNVKFVVKSVVENLARFPIVVVAGQADPANPGATPAASSSEPKPAPATGSGTQQATGNAADDKPKDGDANQVSYVLLYNYYIDENPEPGVFQLISSRSIDSLSSGGGSAGGAMLNKGGGMQGGMGGLGGMGGMSAGAVAGNWQPLGGGGIGGGAGGGAQGGAAGASTPAAGGGKMGAGMAMMMQRGAAMQQGMRAQMNASKSGTMGFDMGAPSASGPDATPKKAKGKHVRTEFVIFFVWKEPTPSDKLLPEEGAPQ
jgi:type IV pilus assembly protein PilM